MKVNIYYGGRGVLDDPTLYVLNKMDNNGLFAVNGHISKIEYPVNPDMMDNAAEKFDFLYEKFIKGKTDKVYLSVVPDKNIFFGLIHKAQSSYNFLYITISSSVSESLATSSTK